MINEPFGFDCMLTRARRYEYCESNSFGLANILSLLYRRPVIIPFTCLSIIYNIHKVFFFFVFF